MRRALALVSMAALAACSGETPDPVPQETEIPESLATAPAAPENIVEGEGTPLAERVATIGLLNKRNNRSQDLEMKPGESKRVGNVIVRLAACERTPQWESPPETGAFVQVLVEERPESGSDPEWRTAFSGWLFKNSPSLNVVQHPVYDVWVKDCAMSFPGESSGPAEDSSD